jgi:hypothetical protein
METGVNFRVGVVVTTIGRWEAVERLLASISATTPVAIANQSGEPAPASIARSGLVEIVTSWGGISRGRNDAMKLLKGETEIMAFPNDHSQFQEDTIPCAISHFTNEDPPGAVAGSLLEPTGIRFRVPKAGTSLTDWTVWRAIEPAMFIASHLAETMKFREDLGTGSSSPWQAGEGTDLLLRIMHAGYRVVAAPDVIVRSDGERRQLTPDEWRVKLRSYARGTGYVLRLHDYGLFQSTMQIALPWYRFVRVPTSGVRTPARDCLEASVGRLEGRLGHCLASGRLRLDKTALKK